MKGSFLEAKISIPSITETATVNLIVNVLHFLLNNILIKPNPYTFINYYIYQNLLKNKFSEFDPRIHQRENTPQERHIPLRKPGKRCLHTVLRL